MAIATRTAEQVPACKGVSSRRWNDLTLSGSCRPFSGSCRASVFQEAQLLFPFHSIVSVLSKMDYINIDSLSFHYTFFLVWPLLLSHFDLDKMMMMIMMRNDHTRVGLESAIRCRRPGAVAIDAVQLLAHCSQSSDIKGHGLGSEQEISRSCVRYILLKIALQHAICCNKYQSRTNLFIISISSV